MSKATVISMTCRSCGGTLQINSDKTIIVCPYCGSKKIVLESDKVKIQRIKSGTERDLGLASERRKLETKRLETELELERERLKDERQRADLREDLIRGAACLIVMILIFLLIVFATNRF